MTRAELVVDASVLAAALFDEERASEAEWLLGAATRLIAPELLVSEMVSIGVKKVWLSVASADHAQAALRFVPKVINEFVATQALAADAMDLAITHRISSYDALYVALARSECIPLLTFDDKLRRKVEGAGLSKVLLPL